MNMEMIRPIATAALAFAAAGTTLVVPAQTPERSLAFISEPGDPVGEGRSATLRPLFEYAQPDGLLVSATDGLTPYLLTMAPPAGQTLRTGIFEDARGGDQQMPGLPVLSFSSSQACEGSTGRSEITDIAFDSAGYIVRLRANFEQRCIGASGALFGDIALDAGLTDFTAVLERYGQYHPDDATAYMDMQCDVAAVGSAASSAVQSAPHRTEVVSRTRGNFMCPGKAQLHLSASGGTWRPGPVELRVDAAVSDPHYVEGSRYVRKTITGTVYLRP